MISARRVRVARERRGSIVDDRGVQLHAGFGGPLEFSERLPPLNCPRLFAACVANRAAEEIPATLAVRRHD